MGKKYYWLQLKEDFFRQKEIKLLRKIAGRRAQCWRVSKRLIEDSLKTINEIDAVLFKTNAFPNIKQKDSIILTD